MKNHLPYVLFLLMTCFTLISYAQPYNLTSEIVSYIANTSLSVRDVHSDCKGNIVFVGGTGSTNFAITPGTVSTAYHGGNCDAFVVKIDSSGNTIFRTLLGGTQYDRAYAVEIDSAGFIYVAGRAGNGFQTSTCALQTTFLGDNFPNPEYGVQDGFITKLTPDGSAIVWSTYLGDIGRGFIRDIDLDSHGNVWIGVSSASSSFPYITSNAVQSTTTAVNNNSALVKLSADGRTVLYGTFLTDGQDNTSPTVVRVDKDDNVYFLSTASANTLPITPGAFQPIVAGGRDFAIAKYNSSGGLLFCSLLGGTGDEELETHTLEIDSSGNAIVAGFTSSSNYPVVGSVVQPVYGGGVQDGVVTKINKTGTAILASTYVGGSLADGVEGIGIDINDNIYVTGSSRSANFPVTTTAYQSVNRGGSDGVFTVLSSNLSTRLYASYVGGSGDDQLRTCHVSKQGKFYAGGNTASINYPISNAFNNSLTGSLTGTALVFRTNQLLPLNACNISNTFTNPCGALPLLFMYFTASGYGDSIKLNWRIEREINITRFLIEKSKDGIHFNQLGTQPNDNFVVSAYHFTDKNVYTGHNYYRLKVMNLDGTFTYSKIVLVDYYANENVIIRTNPVKDKLNVLLKNFKIASAIQIRIFNINGQILFKNQVKATAEISNISVAVQDFASGLYFLKLIQEDNVQIIKWIKE